MGECLNKSVPGSESWLIQTVRRVCSLRERRLRKKPFVFEMSTKAAKQNSETLKKFTYDYPKLVSQFKNTVLSPGSEFRALSHLELIGNHEDWKIIKNQLEKEMIYPMSELPDGKTWK